MVPIATRSKAISMANCSKLKSGKMFQRCPSRHWSLSGVEIRESRLFTMGHVPSRAHVSRTNQGIKILKMPSYHKLTTFSRLACSCLLNVSFQVSLFTYNHILHFPLFPSVNPYSLRWPISLTLLGLPYLYLNYLYFYEIHLQSPSRGCTAVITLKRDIIRTSLCDSRLHWA